jgi:hypothetical protein
MAAAKRNKNAEYWTESEAENLFNKALDLSYNQDYDFIGEIARDLRTYRDIFTYLSNKFENLKDTYKLICSNLEANCFSHGKKESISVPMAKMNLKANYNWTDKPQESQPQNVTFTINVPDCEPDFPDSI